MRNQKRWIKRIAGLDQGDQKMKHLGRQQRYIRKIGKSIIIGARGHIIDSASSASTN